MRSAEEMGSVAPPPPPAAYPDEPSNRWPWVALVLGLLVVAAAVIFFFVNRPATTNITVEGTPSPNPVAAGTASPGPPPTLVPPTLPASATLAPTATPQPSPTAAPTQPPTPPPPTQAPTQAVAPTQGPTQAAPAAPSNATPQTPQATPGTPAATPPPASAASPSPTPFAGQVSNPGGIGNARTDLDAAYGPPVGETPEHLVVYRKNNFEFHVGYVPDPNGRAALIVELPQQTATPVPLEQAQAEGHKLLPKDAQPPNPAPEGNNQFVVERFTSQTLAQALPPEVFSANNGTPGQLMIVYVKDAQGRIPRWIVGPGNDPNALINQGR